MRVLLRRGRRRGADGISSPDFWGKGTLTQLTIGRWSVEGHLLTQASPLVRLNPRAVPPHAKQPRQQHTGVMMLHWRVFPRSRLQITRRDRRICCSWVRLTHSAEKMAKDMADIAIVVLFISACASLFGLGLFLFREQIISRR